MKASNRIKRAWKSLFVVVTVCIATALVAHAQLETMTPPQFWTPFSGDWELADGQLMTLTSGQENWIWAGNPAVVFQGDLDARLKVEFASIPGDEIGRHGGIMFFSSVATHRFDLSMNGYTIDWIDRTFDHGFRLFRWDNGWFVPLASGGGDLADPPQLWQLKIRGDVIRFSADGQLIFEAVDATYRQGHFGIWAHGWAGGNIQHLLVDDVQVGTTFHDNFDPLPLLNLQRFGNNIVLSWADASFGLQSASAVTGTFTNLPNTASPYTNALSGGQQFFRLTK